jgi:hypothetical protein
MLSFYGFQEGRCTLYHLKNRPPESAYFDPFYGITLKDPIMGNGCPNSVPSQAFYPPTCFAGAQMNKATLLQAIFSLLNRSIGEFITEIA